MHGARVGMCVRSESWGYVHGVRVEDIYARSESWYGV